eukprot:15340307-Ditylum_brightwellii.AAC.1
MIVAAEELEYGVDNMLKKGITQGRRDYPGFGQYVPKNTFNAFCSGVPYAWCYKQFLYEDECDKNESMSAWRPKTSKLGGLPNIKFEKCKPIEFGSMLKNSLKYISGVFNYQDIVQSPE